MKKLCLLLLCSLPILLWSACSPKPATGDSSSITLTGAGSTFVYPLMERWASDFHALHPRITINYQSLGSGAGIQQVKNGTVDFGASDAALTDQQLAKMPPVAQVAESAGPVCLTYNLDGVPALRLTAATVSGIYLGAITRWDDVRIAADNAGLKLPHQSILVAHRSDGSGTTSIFTHYLSAVNQVWKTRVGAGISVAWPVGLGGKGSAGVAGIVRQTPGAIGYVELTYAAENKLPVARVRNAAGRFVAPSVATSAAAIAASAPALERDVRTPIVNAAGPDSYPITGLTFLIVPKREAGAARAAALRQFLDYVLGPGQAAARALYYAPLPDSLLRLGRRRVP